MAVNQIRTLGSFLVGVLVIAAMLVPNDAFAKKKRKGKKGEKAKLEAPAELIPQEKARQHYTKGKDLYDGGKFEEALVEFNTAYETKPHPTVLKSIAECQVATGDPKGALETFDKYLADPEAGDKASVAARVEQIKNQPVGVSITSVPEGAAIAVAGSTLDKVTPAAIELTPGEYMVTLSVEGYEPVSKSISVVLGEKAEVLVDFAKDAPPPEPKEDAIVDPFAEETMPEASTAPEVEEEKSGPPTAFWVAAAITGVGLVTGTVFGTMALGDEEDYKEDPTPAKKEAGERDAIIADVSFGVAGAAAIAGIVILVTNARKQKRKSAADSAKV